MCKHTQTWYARVHLYTHFKTISRIGWVVHNSQDSNGLIRGDVINFDHRIFLIWIPIYLKSITWLITLIIAHCLEVVLFCFVFLFFSLSFVIVHWFTLYHMLLLIFFFLSLCSIPWGGRSCCLFSGRSRKYIDMG